jgi:hypothetical protein
LRTHRWGIAGLLLRPRSRQRRQAQTRRRQGREEHPNVELKEIKASIKDLTERVLTGRVDTGPAAIANQLMNTHLRIIELERRWKEVGELEGRMEALDDVLKWRKTG